MDKTHDFFHEEDLALVVVANEDIPEENTSPNHFEEEDTALSIECLDHQRTERNGEWYIDSACRSHMTYEQECLMDFRLEEKAKAKIHLGDNSVILAVGEGKVHLSVGLAENDLHLALQTAAYVPDLTKNLLSVPAMTRTGAEVRFTNEKCIVEKGGKQYTIGHLVGGKLYRVGVSQLRNDSAYYTSENNSSKDVRHHRFGHLNKRCG